MSENGAHNAESNKGIRKGSYALRSGGDVLGFTTASNNEVSSKRTSESTPQIALFNVSVPVMQRKMHRTAAAYGITRTPAPTYLHRYCSHIGQFNSRSLCVNSFSVTTQLRYIERLHIDGWVRYRSGITELYTSMCG